MPSNNTGGFESDIIIHLLESVFKIKADNEKLEIVQKGRPQPKLVIIKKDHTKNCNRTFQECWYEIHPWLCGSSDLNKLFCWPCLLMRPESSTWCSTGIDDVKRLSTITSKHGSCKSHLKAITEYDATLVGFGLPPEFVKEANMNCKVEQGNVVSESEDDLFDQYFIVDPSKPKGIKKEYEGLRKPQTSETAKDDKKKISFKAWRELNSGAVTSQHIRESQVLFRWKKKQAKQDLYNARLKARKLKLEIELLKAKLEYQNALNTDVTHNQNTCQQVDTSSATNVETIIP